jgi:hypothetical protein
MQGKQKHQKRIDYDWDGKEANFVDSVLTFVKEYLFLRYKFLKDGWMEYDNGLYGGRSKSQKKWITRINGRE